MSHNAQSGFELDVTNVKMKHLETIVFIFAFYPLAKFEFYVDQV